MRSRISEAEAVRRMSAHPGFAVDPDGMGHRLQSPHGLIWHRNVRLTDEGFESEVWGTLNISLAYRLIGALPDKLQRLNIEQALRNTARVEINVGYAKRLPKDRLRVPVLAAFDGDGWHVIDGAHRIFQLNRLRKKSVGVMFASSRLLRAIRVRRFVQGDNGEWLPRDSVSEEAFERVLMEGEKFRKRLESVGAG